MNLAKLPMRDASYTFEFPDPFAIKCRPSVAVAEAPDHSSSIAHVALYVKHIMRRIQLRIPRAIVDFLRVKGTGHEGLRFEAEARGYLGGG